MSYALFKFTVIRHRVVSGLLFMIPVIVGLFTGVFFPENRKDREMLAQVAKIFRKALDEEAILDVVSPAGFFNVAFQHPLTVLALIFAASIPLLTLPASDRGRGSLDLLLATPLRRHGPIVSAFAASLLFVLFLGIAPLLGVTLGARFANVGDDVPLSEFLWTSINFAGLGVWFAGLAACVASFAPDGPAAMRRFGCGVFFAFAIQVAGQLWKGNTWVRNFGPFGWYRPSLIVAHKGNPMLDTCVLVGTGLLLVAAACVISHRRRRA